MTLPVTDTDSGANSQIVYAVQSSKQTLHFTEIQILLCSVVEAITVIAFL